MAAAHRREEEGSPSGRPMGKAHGVPLPAPLAALRAASPARRLLLCLLAGCLAAPAALLLARCAGAGGAPGPGHLAGLSPAAEENSDLLGGREPRGHLSAAGGGPGVAK